MGRLSDFLERKWDIRFLPFRVTRAEVIFVLCWILFFGAALALIPLGLFYLLMWSA